MPSRGNFFLALFCLLFFSTNFLFGSDDVFANDNLLTNADFDDWDNSGPLGWQRSATGNFTVTNSSGAAFLTLTTANYRYLYQTASVSGSTSYRLSGLIKNISGSASAFLRLAWYCQTCTSQLSTDDSSPIEKILDNFSEVFLEVTSPPTAAFVKARVMVVPQSGSTNNQILADKMFLGLANSGSTTTSDATVSSKPIINWSAGTGFDLGETFGINVSLANFDPNGEYYLKIRGGLDEANLNKVQTRNGNNFYADTQVWNDLPLIKTNGQGSWSGDISGQIDSDKPEGTYKIRLRVRRKDSETSTDSDLKEIKFSLPLSVIAVPPSVQATPSYLMTPVFNEEASSSALASSEADILGTMTTNLLGNSATSSDKQTKPTPQFAHQLDFGSLALVVGGLISLGLSVLPLFRKMFSMRV